MARDEEERAEPERGMPLIFGTVLAVKLHRYRIWQNFCCLKNCGGLKCFGLVRRLKNNLKNNEVIPG